MKSLEEQLKIIKKGTLDIINEEELIKKLEKSIKENKPLKIKLGLDPSAPDIHLGHTVVLRKLKQLQDLGHEIIIIIGDFTGKIGDPTGKSRMRKFLSDEEVLQNAKTYEEQVFKILDKEKTTIKFNREWLSKLTFGDVLKLTASTTVARMLEREDFKLRFENQRPIYLNEFFYPLMQAFDSTAIEADIESSDGLRCISYQMVKLANQYPYLASVMSYIKVFLRRAREDGNKDVVNLLVDKKDIIENALKTVSQKHAVLSRQITIKSDIMKELNMGSQR